jgi:hypothetical protein
MVTVAAQLVLATLTVFDAMFDIADSTPSERIALIPALTSPGARQNTYSNGVTGRMIGVALAKPDGASAMKSLKPVTTAAVPSVFCVGLVYLAVTLPVDALADRVNVRDCDTAST